MPITLTDDAQLELEKNVHENSLVVEIDGYDTIYTSCTLLKKLEYGDEVDYGEAGLYYGGNVKDPRGTDYINLGRSTNAITQQLEQDRGSAQGVTSIEISMVDKAEQLSQAFSPNQVVDDPLGANARVYLSINNSAHPTDTILLLSGIVQGVEFGCAEVKLTIGSPEQKKRAKLYEVITTKLDGAISDSDTTIGVTDTAGIYEDQDALTTYIQIEDEIIKVGAISGNNFTSCTRGQFGTFAVAHDDDTEVKTRYRIVEEGIILALKLMMSGSGVLPDTFAVKDFVNTLGPNDILIPAKDFELRTGLTVGDLINSSGATNGANNFTNRTILEIEEVDLGTRIEVSGSPLVTEIDSSAILSFQSKYDVLPAGFQLDSRQVDVTQHEFLKSLLAGDFPTMDFFLKEEIDIEFLHSQVYFPIGLYSIPRKGKASCNITLPPLALNKVYSLNDCNVKNPEKLRIKRSINKYFYNAVVWKYNPDQVEDKFLNGNVTLSTFSKERIKVQNRPLLIEAEGLRDTGTVSNFIGVQTTRFLDRYQFGAEWIKVEALFSVGLPIEVGDAVIFGENLPVTDITLGQRDFKPRLMEVVQKSLNLKTCNVEFTLVDTKVGLRARFGVIAPSSPISAGSTTERLFLSDSQTLPEVFGVRKERDKWPDYIGSKVSVHSQDWGDNEEVTLVGFDTGSDNGIIVSPPLTFTPGPNHVVDAPTYPDDTNPKEQFIWKELHVYTDAVIDVVSGISDTQLTIAAADLPKVFKGTPVEVHAPDYTYTSSVDPAEGDALIDDITGTTITLNRSLGFTPAPGDKMQLNSFPDEGYPYRYI